MARVRINSGGVDLIQHDRLVMQTRRPRAADCSRRKKTQLGLLRGARPCVNCAGRVSSGLHDPSQLAGLFVC